MDLQLLMDCREYLSVAHHVPGRIRLRFSLGVLSDPRAMDLLASARDTVLPAAVRSVRVNPPARSVVIEYNTAVIAPDLLEEVLTTRDEERFRTLATHLKTLAPQA